jgi:hypothetical protein
MRFFRTLNDIVQAEPWLERDKAMIDILKTIGIERGKPFSPDANKQQILNEAIKEAHLWLDGLIETMQPFYQGARWFFLDRESPLGSGRFRVANAPPEQRAIRREVAMDWI